MITKPERQFQKFVQYAVTEALKRDPDAVRAFSVATSTLARSFQIISRAGYDYGDWVRNFDILFLMPHKALVVDVEATIWIRSVVLDAPDGTMGWVPMRRGDPREGLVRRVVPDSDMILDQAGPLALNCPVLELLGDPRISWLKDDESEG